MSAILHLDSASRPRSVSGQPMPFATLKLLRSGTEEVLATYTADVSGDFSPITDMDVDNILYRVQLHDASGVLRYDVDPYATHSPTYIDAQKQALEDEDIAPGFELLFTSDASMESKIDIYAACDAILDPDEGPLFTARVPHPNPIKANASGLFPPIYVGLGLYYANGAPFGSDDELVCSQVKLFPDNGGTLRGWISSEGVFGDIDVFPTWWNAEFTENPWVALGFVRDMEGGTIALLMKTNGASPYGGSVDIGNIASFIIGSTTYDPFEATFSAEIPGNTYLGHFVGAGGSSWVWDVEDFLEGGIPLETLDTVCVSLGQVS